MPTKTKKRSVLEAERKKIGLDHAPKEDESVDDNFPKQFKRLLQQKEYHESKKKEIKKGNLKNKKKKDYGKIQRLPGERLSEFSQRVNKAIPVSFKSGPSKIDEFTDKKEKKKIAKRKEKRERDWNEIEENFEDKTWEADTTGQFIQIESRKKRKNSPDPWANLQTKPSFGETVQAPPELPELKIKETKYLENVPKVNSMGQTESLARRQALGKQRLELIEKYRELMKTKRK